MLGKIRKHVMLQSFGGGSLEGQRSKIFFYRIIEYHLICLFNKSLMMRLLCITDLILGIITQVGKNAIYIGKVVNDIISLSVQNITRLNVSMY